jgi:hypothetical protein
VPPALPRPSATPRSWPHPAGYRPGPGSRKPDAPGQVDLPPMAKDGTAPAPAGQVGPTPRHGHAGLAIGPRPGRHQARTPWPWPLPSELDPPLATAAIRPGRTLATTPRHPGHHKPARPRPLLHRATQPPKSPPATAPARTGRPGNWPRRPRTGQGHPAPDRPPPWPPPRRPGPPWPPWPARATRGTPKGPVSTSKNVGKQ